MDEAVGLAGEVVDVFRGPAVEHGDEPRGPATTLLQLVAEHNLSHMVDHGNYSPGCGRMTA